MAFHADTILPLVLADVADAAVKVLIYRYFGGLPGLLATYGERGDFWWQVEDLMADLLADGSDLRELPSVLSVLLRRHSDFLRSHPVTLEVIAWICRTGTS